MLDPNPMSEIEASPGAVRAAANEIGAAVARQRRSNRESARRFARATCFVSFEAIILMP